MPVTGATIKNEIIIDCGVEGGAWTLLRRRGMRGGWRFRVIRDEGTLLDFMNEEDREGFELHHGTAWVIWWEAALALFDEYPWHTFCPVRVHPDFAGRIWATVQERIDAATHHEDDWARDNHKRWYRLCHGAGAVISGVLFERANPTDDLAAVLSPEQRQPASMSKQPSPRRSSSGGHRSVVIPALLLAALLAKAASGAKPEHHHRAGAHIVRPTWTGPGPDAQAGKAMPVEVAEQVLNLLRKDFTQCDDVIEQLQFKGWRVDEALARWCDYALPP